MTTDLADAFAAKGFALPHTAGAARLLTLLSPDQLPACRAEADRLLEHADASGARDVLNRSPVIRDLADRLCAGPLLAALDAAARWRPVRAIIFNKTPGRNWALRWHQDTALAFRERIETPGFGSWSEKDGIPHALSPTEVLRQIVTVRLHLDDTDRANGALEVLAGSHNAKLSRDQVSEAVKAGQPALCELKAGQAMLMRPLTLHRSGKVTGEYPEAHGAEARPKAVRANAREPSERPMCVIRKEGRPAPEGRQITRRIIHIEFAPMAAPGELEWYGG